MARKRKLHFSENAAFKSAIETEILWLENKLKMGKFKHSHIKILGRTGQNIYNDIWTFKYIRRLNYFQKINIAHEINQISFTKFWT